MSNHLPVVAFEVTCDSEGTVDEKQTVGVRNSDEGFFVFLFELNASCPHPPLGSYPYIENLLQLHLTIFIFWYVLCAECTHPECSLGDGSKEARLPNQCRNEINRLASRFRLAPDVVTVPMLLQLGSCFDKVQAFWHARKSLAAPDPHEMC